MKFTLEIVSSLLHPTVKVSFKNSKSKRWKVADERAANFNHIPQKLRKISKFLPPKNPFPREKEDEGLVCVRSVFRPADFYWSAAAEGVRYAAEQRTILGRWLSIDQFATGRFMATARLTRFHLHLLLLLSSVSVHDTIVAIFSP